MHWAFKWNFWIEKRKRHAEIGKEWVHDLVYKGPWRRKKSKKSIGVWDWQALV
jgi:hypothetical protein